ncbi:group II intron reverse transcriptase/maturase, partial [Wolbachia pipientis]
MRSSNLCLMKIKRLLHMRVIAKPIFWVMKYMFCMQMTNMIIGHNDGINGSIGLRVPHHIKQKKCSEYMRCGKPIHLPQRTIDTAYSIVAQYQTEYRGIVQYYKMAYNLHTLSYLKYVM